MYRYAEKQGLITNNPVKTVSGLPENNKRVRWLSDDERKALLEACRAEGRDRVMVRMHIASNKTEGDRIVGRLLQLATGKYPCFITIKQQRQQHSRMIRLLTTATITLHQFTQVKLIHNIDYEACQMLLRQPVLQRGGNRYAVS